MSQSKSRLRPLAAVLGTVAAAAMLSTTSAPAHAAGLPNIPNPLKYYEFVPVPQPGHARGCSILSGDISGSGKGDISLPLKKQRICIDIEGKDLQVEKAHASFVSASVLFPLRDWQFNWRLSDNNGHLYQEERGPIHHSTDFRGERNRYDLNVPNEGTLCAELRSDSGLTVVDSACLSLYKDKQPVSVPAPGSKAPAANKPASPAKKPTTQHKPASKPASASPLLAQGSRGKEVKQAQTLLRKHGYKDVAVDGIFGPKTEAAVRKFQASKHLAIDGLIGPQTWKELRQ